ncbi:uncharacterized protein BO66DRAFT_440993 [Aspergillus aculeatinus CBS 121060]|uniref:Uncharacterized protein n=1 Tax=Aspergillus aculeatinus CBS 121060 TaxID=1448322 RepID=A0ACD1H288_9EURO|nr:hypothetical protein BO66DRAFT_440993 [Aspergillus aculeatinus CBS 121060]RAH67536.1 hypothetical protein BO66DRAFT_440993 [Aspergillus aculeatinus CBS 121060]
MSPSSGVAAPTKSSTTATRPNQIREATRLLDEGTIVPHPVQFWDGGLPGVIPGLHALREGKTVRGLSWCSTLKSRADEDEEDDDAVDLRNMIEN